jgi:hypothetical protein
MVSERLTLRGAADERLWTRVPTSEGLCFVSLEQCDERIV